MPPSQNPDCLGWAVAVGETPDDVLDSLKAVRGVLKDCPVTIKIESLAELFKQIIEAEKKGIEFSGGEVPEPAAVLED
jgi:hypothetical protein